MLVWWGGRWYLLLSHPPRVCSAHAVHSPSRLFSINMKVFDSLVTELGRPSAQVGGDGSNGLLARQDSIELLMPSMHTTVTVKG